MPKALVILAQGFEETEAVTVVDILRRSGTEVTIAGLSDLRVQGSRGVVILAEKKLDRIKLNFDALILPGGGLGAKNLKNSKKVASIIKTMHRQNKIIAAICAAPAIVLAPTGILNHRSATGYPGMEKYFNKTTKFKIAPVVIDKNIVTSRGPATAAAFALAIVEKLSGKTIAKRIKKDILA